MKRVFKYAHKECSLPVPPGPLLLPLLLLNTGTIAAWLNKYTCFWSDINNLVVSSHSLATGTTCRASHTERSRFVCESRLLLLGSLGHISCTGCELPSLWFLYQWLFAGQLHVEHLILEQNNCMLDCLLWHNSLQDSFLWSKQCCMTPAPSTQVSVSLPPFHYPESSSHTESDKLWQEKH